MKTANSREQWLPRIDIHSADKKLVIDADIPGVDKRDIKIEIENGILRIFGERRMPERAALLQERTPLLEERNYGSFERSFELPDAYDLKSIKAVYRGGVLTLSIPRSVKTEPCEIPVDYA